MSSRFSPGKQKPPICASLESMKDNLNSPSLHPQAADIADRLERLSPESGRKTLEQLPAAEVAAILRELDVKDAARLLVDVDADKILAWVQFLPPNITADMLSEQPAARREQVLAALPPHTSEAVVSLLRYPPDSAGGVMDNRFVVAGEEQTADQCLAHLRGAIRQRGDEVTYIYVVDNAERLVGVVSLRDLVFAAPGTRLRELMNREIGLLRVSDDQEEVARQMQRYRFLALPVIDEQERLVGIVKIRDALRIAQTEATEDMQLMVGVAAQEHIWTPWNEAIRRRLPWLGVNMGTALLAATVVSYFEGTIARWTALVVFLPLISAVAGNAGIQALTVIIRALALGEVMPGDAGRALRKELAIGLINGCVLGLLIGFIGFGWKGSLLLGAVAGAAMLVNQVLGALSGVAIPFGLRWCKVDPALASGIFVTTLTDIIGFLVFLGLAAMAIRAFGL